MMYGYEQPIQLPTLDLYDKLIMAMAINAAKDMYEKGLAEIKEFNKQYGDFISPFTKDMDRYNEIMSGVKGLIDDAYANGIDLLRNPQGRFLIQKAINSINPTEINRMRTNAEMGFKYLQAVQLALAKGEYDPDFENFALTRQGGPGLFENFSSANGAMWNRPGPSTFKDVNQWTHHLFDNMELSYDPEETKKYPGYMAYTKSRDTMNKIVDDNIAQLLNTDLGKYYLQDALNSIPDGFQGDRKEEALRRLKERVVNANMELNRVKLETDPYAIARYSARLSNRDKQKKQSIAYDSAEGLFYRGLIKSGGTSHYNDVEQAVLDGRDNIVQRQIALMKQTQAQKMSVPAAQDYILDNLSIEEATGNFSRYAQIPLTNGIMPIDKHWSLRFYSDESVVSHMYGITYGTHDGGTGKRKSQSKRYTDRTGLVGKQAMPTTKVRTAFTLRANGEYAIRQFWQMDVGELQDDGTWKHEKYMEFELPTSRKATNNMPDYNTWKNMNAEDKDVIIRPSISEDPNTLGWKNTGSMQVNMYEHVPSNLGFPGTSNNEAYETP